MLSHSIVGEFVDASVKDHAKAKKLLLKHPELKSSRWLGESLLRFLAIENCAEGVRFLAKHGWSIREQDQDRGPILIEATQAGAAEAVATLLSLGADPNAVSNTDGNALHCAIRSGYVHLVDILLQGGADPNYIIDFGSTALDALPNKVEKQTAIRALLRQYGLVNPDPSTEPE